MVVRKKTRRWKSAAARRLLHLAGDPPTVEEAIKVVVARTLEGIAYPPFTPEAVFNRLNVSGIEYEDLPFSGELRSENGKHSIVCSTHLSPVRRRFTIAHELAHAIFEQSGSNCPRTGKELERLCDMIATEFLMPESVFVEYANRRPNIDDVLALARKFETSVSATAIRCAELFKISAFEVDEQVVVWGQGVVKRGPIRYLDSALQKLILEAKNSKMGSKVIHVAIGDALRTWDVQYLRTTQDRILFVVRSAPA